MFTGIITAIGQIQHVEDLGSSQAHGKRLSIACPPGYLDDVALGDSIALNGACMTVTALALDAQTFMVEVSAESLRLTAGLDRPGEVNLEKALRATDRLGGHIVSGHVDGVGAVSALNPVGESHELRILAPKQLMPYLAVKGSITVQGVSLTLNSVRDLPEGCEFSINLIAHTMAHTTLGRLRPGSAVNLEVDLIARYVARMLQTGSALPTGLPS
ncbi:riboflavin synthase [Vandammella animalimorsus]|uniref:Riboflavin synthase n=1 Tax=Vandammella animalimorsus TaxID=2029117 RepID=A0A3M6RT11_9BURK|nr:riboflavin synthase [Vandammella animalimorsus]RMX18128.1 riboflavin synthase [Vandammella animalimorsus]